jgi:hypothetical protein
MMSVRIVPVFPLDSPGSETSETLPCYEGRHTVVPPFLEYTYIDEVD